MKGFKNCRRETMLQYFQDGTGLEPVTHTAGIRDLGTLVHSGVEAYYNGGGICRPVAVLREELIKEEGLTPEWIKILKLADIMLQGYEDWIENEGMDVGETTVATELQLSQRIGVFQGVEVHVTGKLDRLVQDNDTGEYIIEDTKTVQSFDDLRWLAMGDQLLTYNVLLRMGPGAIRPNRGRHNQLRKVQRGPTAKPPFYDRTEFPFNDTQVENYWEMLTATVNDMVTCILGIEADPDMHRRYAYPNPTKDCLWRCDFLPICPMMDDGSHWKSTLSEMYRPRSTEGSA